MTTDTKSKVHVPCRVCGQDQPKSYAQEHGFQIVKCQSCGLVYVTPRLSHQALQEIYQDFYHRPHYWDDYLKEKSGQAADGSARPAAKREDRWQGRFEKTWDYLKSHFDQIDSCQMLDIGTGSSLWPAFVKEKGVNIHCMDIADNKHLQALRDRGVPVSIADTPAESEFATQQFDVITLWDVIEHLEEPTIRLQELHRMLKPGGLIFVQTPNAPWIHFKYLVSRFMPQSFLKRNMTPQGIYLPEQHIQLYSLETLNEQLKRTGFEMIENCLIDWQESKGTFLSSALYALIYGQAEVVHLLSDGRRSSNIGLGVIGKKSLKI